MANKEQLSDEQIKQNSTRANYLKTEVVGSLFMLFFVGSIVGICVFSEKEKDDHLNVVIANKDGKLLVRDVNTKQDRIIKLDGTINKEDQDFVFPDDTINIKQKENVYKQCKNVSAKNATIVINRDSLWVRKQRALFNAEKQQIMNQR